jgi:hypothetical protein
MNLQKYPSLSVSTVHHSLKPTSILNTRCRMSLAELRQPTAHAQDSGHKERWVFSQVHLTGDQEMGMEVEGYGGQ